MTTLLSRRTLLAAAFLTLVGAAAARAEFNLMPDLDNNIAAAATANNLDQVRKLIAQGSKVNYTDAQGRTGLIYAANAGYTAVAKVLLENGARTAIADRTGNAALHYAAEGGHLAIVELLLAAKAGIDQQNREGATPLMLAASRGRAAVVKLLIERGADLTVTDYTGRRAVDWAQDHRQSRIAQMLRQADRK